MKTGHNVETLEKFKEQATQILEDAKFPVHKWESNVIAIESEDMPNPGKILGHSWDKREDTLVIQVPKAHEETPLTKRTILSQLGKVRPARNHICNYGARETPIQGHVMNIRAGMQKFHHPWRRTGTSGQCNYKM